VRVSSPTRSSALVRPSSLQTRPVASAAAAELDPLYVDLIPSRYEAAADRAAVLLETGEAALSVLVYNVIRANNLTGAETLRARLA
jgi:hypothetical protein